MAYSQMGTVPWGGLGTRSADAYVLHVFPIYPNVFLPGPKQP